MSNENIESVLRSFVEKVPQNKIEHLNWDPKIPVDLKNLQHRSPTQEYDSSEDNNKF
jgi:hypothetical protein